jgi:hypothetical protein
MKVEKLISKNQPQNWFEKITRECTEEYPIHLVDIDAAEKVIDMVNNIKVDTFIQFYTKQYHLKMVNL